MRPLEVREAAMTEIIEARRWYAERSTVAADQFMAEVDRAFDDIAQNPERWPRYVHNTRRCLLRRFPYLVVYQLRQNTVVVIAIAHAHRRPGYWRSR